MNRRKFVSRISSVVIVGLLVGMWQTAVYLQKLPERVSQHETILLGQSRMVPGSTAALRVVVRDARDASPLPGSEIQVKLQGKPGEKSFQVFQGTTDSNGTTNVAFQVPEDAPAEATLRIETKSRLGSDTIEKQVTLERDYRLLLTTDKPIYQPGQVIHMRILALATFDLKPAAGQSVEIIIADGKGNKVFRQSTQTSEFGAASLDFQLADTVNAGAYKISAQMGNASSEKTVTVETYSLPKYDVQLQTERNYYQPGQRVKATIQADYFYGKPVGLAAVKIEGFTFDVQKNVSLNLQGETNPEGGFEFEFDLPGYIAGSDLEGGMGRFYLQATLTDKANHSETSSLSLPVAQSLIQIEAVPESSQFRPGVENILYVLTGYPDGSPAPAQLTVTFLNQQQTQTVETDPYGLAEIHFVPDQPYQSIKIDARSERGETASRQLDFSGEWYGESILLRPDKPVYKVGETMNLRLFANQSQGTAYLDIVREGQTISTRSVDIQDGRAEVAVDLTPDLYGTLELHAYKILSSGTITRDTRLVVVDAASDLKIQLQLGQDVYRPGDTASLDLGVAGANGEGVKAAIGLAIVDESVFALAEQDPGFARLYFLLEEEILTPKIDLHGFSIPKMVTDPTVTDPVLEKSQAGAAQAALAKSAATKGQFSLAANSHQIAVERSYQLRTKYFTIFGKTTFGLGISLVLVGCGLALLALWKGGKVAESLMTALAVGASGLVALLAWPLGEQGQWIRTPLDRLGLLVQWLSGEGAIFTILLVLLSLVSLISLIVIAVRRKDGLLGGMLALIPLVVAAFAAALYAAMQSSNTGGLENWVIWGLIAYAAFSLAILVRGASFTWQKRPAAGLACLGLIPFLWSLTVPVFGLVAVASGGVMMGAAAPMARNGGPMVMEDALFGAKAGGIALPAAMPTSAPAMPPMAQDAAGRATTSQAVEPPRLRQYFPETMLWLPDAITDDNGQLHLDIPVADSITTWRMTALASSLDGRLGSTSQGLRVFQDFFIDLDLPLSLTVGDEVSIPVGVFNYLKESQTIRLEVEQAGWFDLLDEPTKQIDIGANDISVVYFRIRAKEFGKQSLKVTALGTSQSDAIQKNVRVYPDGKPVRFAYSDRLTAGEPIRQVVPIPEGTIPGTQWINVKIYPGIVSQVVEGLDSLLQMPNGCFEQTSSTTYPNALVLDYLKTSGQVAPETQMKAEEYINLGYQRLTTFEVGSSGGFSLFGDAPADRMLTAYGLQEFSDMNRVHPVDENLLKRAADFLFSSQAGDGSWENDRGLVHESTWQNLGNDRLPVTAYITWSLIDAGYGSDGRTQNGLNYVREHSGEAKDAYVIALAANALVANDVKAKSGISSATQNLLDKLVSIARREGNGAVWDSGVATFMGSEGKTGSLETTALTAYALLRSETNPDLANAALTYLIQQKDANGTWYTTQTTVLALKALLQSMRPGGENADASVKISLNGAQEKVIQVTPDNFDVVQLVAFDDLRPGADNVVDIAVEGKGSLMYQVSGEYTLPWSKLAEAPSGQNGDGLVKIDLQYDRTQLEVNDTVNVDVTVRLLEEGKAEQALIDLGIPPGFDVLTEDLSALVNQYNDKPQDYAGPSIERFEMTGRQVLIYARRVGSQEPLHFSYRLRAKFPLTVQAPASSAYDYYNPDVNGLSRPQTISVTGG